MVSLHFCDLGILTFISLLWVPMASHNGSVSDHSNSVGNTWADQWDHDENEAINGSNRRKDSDYNKQLKAVASTAKSAATSGAKKFKNGTSSGIRWIKVQYEKRSQK
eukprot:Gb_12962 [translate_table: standard]